MSDILAGSPLIQATGFALVAFLWQGAVIGLVAVLLAAASRRASPGARYLVGCVALTALILAPIVTVVRHLEDSSTPVRHGNSALATAVPSQVLVSQGGTAGDLAQGNSPLDDARWSVVVIVWGIGVTALGLHLLRGGLQVARLRRSASPLVGADRLEAFQRLTGQLRLTRPVRLVESWAIGVPAVIGWLRPVVIVPVSALAGLSPSHFEAILAHELAHVRRHDYLVNLVQRVIETLLFYHPAVWWVSGWIRREREHCCDDLAASACGDRVRYAHALRALEELRTAAPALAMGAGGGELLGRIRRLVNRTPDPLPRWPGGLAMIVPLIAFLTIANPGMSASAISLPWPVDAGRLEALLPAAPPPVIVTDSSATVPSVTVAPSTRPAPQPVAVQTAGSISGTVTDPSGGVLPGATVVLSPHGTSETSGRVVVLSSEVSSALANYKKAQADDRLAQASFDRDRDLYEHKVIAKVDLDAAENTRQQARVDLENATRQLKVLQTMVTTTTGSFTFGNLAGGAYDLEVSLAGFKRHQSVVNLAAGQQLATAIPLELGTVAEEVNVLGRSGQTTPPAAQLPSTLLTAADYRAAALYYYDREDFAQADLMMDRAVELARPSEPTRFHQDFASPGVVRVGGDIRPPLKIHDVRPIYPAAALAAGSEGTVLVTAIISRDGSVAGATVTSTPTAFDDAALGAVRQWVFQPTLLNGAPVEVLMNVTVHFKMQ